MKLKITFFTLFVIACIHSSKAQKSQSEETACEEVFIVVEDQPSFPGGEDALKEYIASNTIYPEEEKEKEIEGMVVVKFVVDKDGNVTDAKILKSVNKNIDNEALKVIESMPKWKPGKQGGVNVCVSIVYPIRFILENDKGINIKKPSPRPRKGGSWI